LTRTKFGSAMPARSVRDGCAASNTSSEQLRAGQNY
jgi:hypothetical protein